MISEIFKSCQLAASIFSISAADNMPDGHYGVVENHPWAAPSHDGPHQFPTRRGVAVDGALAARGLSLAEFATIQPLTGIGEQLCILLRQLIYAEPSAAIEPHHDLHRRLLALYSRHSPV